MSATSSQARRAGPAVLRAASAPPSERGRERLLVIDPRHGAVDGACIADLPRLLRPGDLLVVNDAATLPASLHARTPSGQPVEVRLLGAPAHGRVEAVLFGAGDWRTDTEVRAAPPQLDAGVELAFDQGLRARVAAVSPLSARLVALVFDRAGAALDAALYAVGRPVQYSYLVRDLPLAAFQTAYAGAPWAAEMPSAGRPLRGELLLALRQRGVALAALTHAAGLSSTGDPALDRQLPFPERLAIPERTVVLVARAGAAGGRVVAVGTTVVRALEGVVAARGSLVAGAGITDLRIGAGFRPRVVDGVLSGVHAPGESHGQLLAAFAGPALLARAHAFAAGAGYRAHEFGDACLVLSGSISGAGR